MEEAVLGTENQEVFLPLTPTNNKKKHISRRKSEIIFVILMLSLPILQFIIFWIIPNFDSILLAFKNPDGFWDTKYLEMFFDDLAHPADPYYPGEMTQLFYSIKNSLIYFAVNIFIGTPLVIFFSYVLFRKVPLHGIFKVVFYLPSIVGMMVTATLFKEMLNGGPIYELLVKWGLIAGGTNLFKGDLAFVMVVIYSLWTCVGLNMIMFYGAMRRIPTEIFESAEIDGVGFFKQFFRIVIPLIWPTISTLIIFSISGIFVGYGAVMILAPNERHSSMIGWYIISIIENENNLNKPAAIGLMFTVIGLPFVLFIKWLLGKTSANVEY